MVGLIKGGSMNPLDSILGTILSGVVVAFLLAFIVSGTL